MTAVNFAAFSGDLASLLLLINAPNFDNSQLENADDNLLAPVHQAAMLGNDQFLSFLIKKKVNLQKPNKDGLTPLHLAAKNNATRCVEVLLEAGANPKAKDNQGKTPLQLAELYGHKEVIDLLTSKVVTWFRFNIPGTER